MLTIPVRKKAYSWLIILAGVPKVLLRESFYFALLFVQLLQTRENQTTSTLAAVDPALVTRSLSQ